MSKANLIKLFNLHGNYIEGAREDYLNIVVPLYDASINCNWKAAKKIFDKYPNIKLVSQSITEHHETPLHIAASAKVDQKKVKEFVNKLLEIMDNNDLELQNLKSNTTLYLAAIAGNVEAVKLTVDKNTRQLKIPGGSGTMMPLYAAALYGKYEVVSYIFSVSPDLSDADGWDDMQRHWLLEKCCESDMFDVARKIAEKHYKSAYIQEVLGILARKPEAFKETNPNIIMSTIKTVFRFCTGQRGTTVKETALPLLRFLWDKIMHEERDVINDILRGPADSYNRDNKRVSGWAVQASQLQEVIRLHVDDMKNNPPSNQNMNLIKQIKNVSKSVTRMHVATQNIIKTHSYLTIEDNKPISNMENLAMVLQELIFKYIAKLNDYNLMMKMKVPPVAASVFKQEVSKLAKKFEVIVDENVKRFAKETYSSRVLFLAAETGNTVFLVELIRRYPDLIWKKNDNGLSIFHVAVQHRHKDIYNMLHEIGAMKDLITPLKDRKGNNMLHLVGKIAKQKRLEEDVPGVALQMQRELLWFNEVKKMIPLSYIEEENAYGLTPHDLFTKEHDDLVKQGEKWLKGTASQCMVVAALIATIVFAAAFTVPGGYGQINGYGQTIGVPVFHSKATFSIFVVADAISLVLSSTSILFFLSILTSRFSEEDYLKSLPTKLTWGLVTLFFSIASMMVAFGVSFFVLYNKGLIWMPILICGFVVLPAVIYVWLHCDLFFDVLLSTHHFRKLFKPRKRILSYENPKF